jgi:SAD/SRA domain
VADQVLAGRNKALQKALELGLPVRVVRQVVTEHGLVYRYDGLYRITDKEVRRGLSGFVILLFTFRKIYSH